MNTSSNPYIKQTQVPGAWSGWHFTLQDPADRGPCVTQKCIAHAETQSSVFSPHSTGVTLNTENNTDMVTL
jgi:hypothetical protein